MTLARNTPPWPSSNVEKLLGIIGRAIDPRPTIGDAAWSFSHPIDRVAGRGRAENQTMAFPLGGGKWHLTPADKQLIQRFQPLDTSFVRPIPKEHVEALVKNRVSDLAGVKKRADIKTYDERHVDPFWEFGVPGTKLRLKAPPARGMDLPHGLSPYADEIGPRRSGGIYKSEYSGEIYRVLDIKPTLDGHSWGILVESTKSSPQNFGRRWHSTSWDASKDQVVSLGPSSVKK